MFKGFLSDTANNAQELEALNKRLASFYSDPNNQEYWKTADHLNAKYTLETHPFHMHLVRLLDSTSGPILDLGCGSAHLAANLGNSARYYGVDWSKEQTARNQIRFPQSQFAPKDLYNTGLESNKFEWVISLYVLEHCVFPVKFLTQMTRLVRPGGHVAILCPHFRPGLMNSIWHGFLPMPRQQKLHWQRCWDLLPDAWDRYWAMNRRLRKAHKTSGSFLIYRDPRCLHAPYWSDTDAVYWTYETELRRWLEAEGFVIEFDREAVNSALSNTLYLVARKNS